MATVSVKDNQLVISMQGANFGEMTPLGRS